tara:strand:- start:105 stop:860 length:756 start_codon:yes stop_codon:yes gene_type:complete
MYQYLSDYGNKNIKTSDKKFPCTNYIDPTTQNFYNYYNLPSTQNTKIEQIPFYKVSPQNKIKSEQVLQNNEAVMSNGNAVKENYEATNKSQEQPPKSIYHVEEIHKDEKNHQLNNIEVTKEPEQQLLPVLDANYNMREICKQCILLEDHLSHVEKRCPDCCIKHFLALEALSEEAIQLDKEQKLDINVKELPTRIREIQKKWYQSPSHNATQCSQDLRKIRKLLMENSFPVVFNADKNKPMSCSASKCMLK